MAALCLGSCCWRSWPASSGILYSQSLSRSGPLLCGPDILSEKQRSCGLQVRLDRGSFNVLTLRMSSRVIRTNPICVQACLCLGKMRVNAIHMSLLNDKEIFDRMNHNLRSAAQHCVDLAKLPAKGPTYRLFMEEMRAIENCARALAYYRDDSRYLKIGMMMAECHK